MIRSHKITPFFNLKQNPTYLHNKVLKKRLKLNLRKRKWKINTLDLHNLKWSAMGKQICHLLMTSTLLTWVRFILEHLHKRLELSSTLVHLIAGFSLRKQRMLYLHTLRKMMSTMPIILQSLQLLEKTIRVAEVEQTLVLEI